MRIAFFEILIRRNAREHLKRVLKLDHRRNVSVRFTAERQRQTQQMTITPEPARTDDRTKSVQRFCFHDLPGHRLELATALETNAVLQRWSTIASFVQRLRKTRAQFESCVGKTKLVWIPGVVVNNCRWKHCSR